MLLEDRDKGPGDVLKKDANTTGLMLRKKIEPDKETHNLKLIIARARVTPSSFVAGKLRKSLPRTEMRGFNLLVGLLIVILHGLLHVLISILLGINNEAEDQILQTRFTNRAAEAKKIVAAKEASKDEVAPLTTDQLKEDSDADKQEINQKSICRVTH